MSYRIILSSVAEEDYKAFKKINGLIEELKEHPKTGTGKPEQLRFGILV